MRKSVSPPHSGFSVVAKIHSLWAMSLFVLAFAAFMLVGNMPLAAQEDAGPGPDPQGEVAGIAPGEAFVTRFSGTRIVTGQDGEQTEVIDNNGVSGSVIDLRNPGSPPSGQHWKNEPQKFPVFTRDVGQVFGIALDDATPANIYISATAAFGLHRNGDNTGWMDGMWGAGGGPGTIYKLSASNNYQPEVFANVTLSGRQNTGASLGNIAFDKISRQLFVSDMETGMIHRLNIETGQEVGIFDHGVDGRGNFLDVASGSTLSLPRQPFDPSSAARVADCEANFSTTVSCWNIAHPKRRVWGLGVHAGPDGTTRLFYGSWGSLDPLVGEGGQAGEEGQAGDGGNAGAENGQNGENGQNDQDDKANWIWSVGIRADGSFAVDDVRREAMLPVIKTSYGEVLAAPSDIAFSAQGVMLVAERGGMRHLKGDPESPFTQPGISRVLRFNRGENGNWSLEGLYGVGNLNGAGENQPDEYYNAGGGVAWGYGYDSSGNIDLNKADQFVWVSGDSLCSKLGACFDQQTNAMTDEDHVTGVEGRPVDLLAGNLAKSYKIDTDINVNQFGQVDYTQASKNDDSRVGDIEIYQAGPPEERTDEGYGIITPPPVFVHSSRQSHGKYGSHARSRSHYRKRSHNANKSHLRYGSHARLESHYRLWSHQRLQSHQRYASHDRRRSHKRYGSHNGKKSHYRLWSHQRRKSHARYSSHDRRRSHVKYGSHNKKRSHLRTGSHNKKRSHLRTGSHNKRISHQRIGSHNKRVSHKRIGSHNKKRSHLRIGSHNKRVSHKRIGSHNKKRSHLRIGSHNKHVSHKRIGSHNKKRSHLRTGSHNKKVSHARTRSHNKKVSHARTRSHNKVRSHLRARSHNKKRSHQKRRSHIRTTSQVRHI